MTGALIAAATLTAAPALAQDTSAVAVTMEATVGLRGFVHPDRATRVIASITAQELVVGSVEVRISGRTVATAVEVPAGSTKQFVLDVPALARSRQITVDLLDEAGAAITSSTLRVTVPRDQLLVGVFDADSAVSTIRAAVSTPLGLSVTALQLDGNDLIGDIAVLGYLISGPGALSGLDAEATANLKSWLAGGGRLVTTASEGALFAVVESGLPIARTDAVAVEVVSGEVIAVPSVGDVDADEWSAILRDIPPIGLITDYSRQDATGQLLSAATSGQEASVPGLPWLLAGIIVFVLLIGPVNFLVLRALDRPEYAWVTVPGLSIIFVFAFWFVGKGQIQDFTVTHASIVVERGGVAQGSATLVMQAADAGLHTLGVPADWSIVPPSTSFGIETGRSTVVNGAPAMVFDLDALGVGAADAQWRGSGMPLDIAVATVGEAIQITATNPTDSMFWAWGVVVDGRVVGAEAALESGGSAVLEILKTSGSSNSFGPVINEAAVRRSVDRDRDDRRQVAVSLGASVEGIVPEMRYGGTYLYAFTGGSSPTVSVDGVTAVPSGTTLFVEQLSLDDEARYLRQRATPQLLGVEGQSSLEAYYGDIYAYGATAVYLRYDVPATKVPALVRISPGFTRLDIAEAFNWSTGQYDTIAWGTDFDPTRYVSATGELVVRGSVEQTDDRFDSFFDESLQLSRWQLTWSVS